MLFVSYIGKGIDLLDLFLGLKKKKRVSKDASLNFPFLLHTGTLSPLFSVLLWIAVALCTAMLFFISKPVGIRPFLVSVILRSIYTIGLGPTLILLGAANVST